MKNLKLWLERIALQLVGTGQLQNKTTVKLPQANQFLVYYANKDAGHVVPHGEVISCCALLLNKASTGLFPLTNKKYSFFFLVSEGMKFS